MVLHTTKLKVQYLDGHLHCIKYGDEEIVRMMYTALRNHQWFTVPMSISDEKIIQGNNSFQIHYIAHYRMDDIDYEAEIEITGHENDLVSFQFKGTSNSDFLKNRIGICIHHPINECLGQPVSIAHPDGEIISSSFPVLIDPDVIFKNIRKFSWTTPGDIKSILEFEGDIFESEDQRNWNDNSFKTYSTPVAIPYPVLVKRGELIEQKVKLNILGLTEITGKSETESIESEMRYPFPALGYSRSDKSINNEYLDLFKQIIFDHYRVVIDFSLAWNIILDQAILEASEIKTKLELVVFFDDYIREYDKLRKKLNNHISTLLILQKNSSIADQALLDYLVPRIMFDFPFIKIGMGTDGHFVDLNRNRNIDTRLDFVSYSITPQAHLSDDLILIENLEAPAHAIATLSSFTDKPIHLSPITLRSRSFPAFFIDTRQHADFIANWTAMFFKYTAGVAHITLFEAIGPSGIINEDGPSPVYDFLKRISAFRPKFIIKIKVLHPLEKDNLILENERGERMVLEAMF